MASVSFLSPLYVTAPPVKEQEIFKNNVTTWLINFSEYVFSIPCKYPTYEASLDLTLTEVYTSTLKKATLIAFWIVFAVFHRSLWKVGVCLACVKLWNRMGFPEASPPIRASSRPSKGSGFSPSKSFPTPSKDKGGHKGTARVEEPKPSPAKSSAEVKKETPPGSSRDHASGAEASSNLGMSFVVVDRSDASAGTCVDKQSIPRGISAEVFESYYG